MEAIKTLILETIGSNREKTAWRLTEFFIKDDKDNFVAIFKCVLDCRSEPLELWKECENLLLYKWRKKRCNMFNDISNMLNDD